MKLFFSLLLALTFWSALNSAPLELSGMASLGETNLGALAAHVGEYQRLYPDLYRFRRYNQNLRGPFQEWFRALVQEGRARGIEVDADMAPPTEFVELVLGPQDQELGPSNEDVAIKFDGNVVYSGSRAVQSYQDMGAVADRTLFGAGYVQSVGSYSNVLTVVPQPPDYQAALDHGREQLPAGRDILKMEVGGRLWQDDHMFKFSDQQMNAYVSRSEAPDRAADGRLTVDTGSGVAAYYGPVFMVHWIQKAREAGVGGICLDPADMVDPNFWRWGDINKARFQAAGPGTLTSWPSFSTNAPPT